MSVDYKALRQIECDEVEERVLWNVLRPYHMNFVEFRDMPMSMYLKNIFMLPMRLWKMVKKAINEKPYFLN